jgi:hypothetical protein
VVQLVTPDRPLRVEGGTGVVTNVDYAGPAGGRVVVPPARAMRLRVVSSLEPAGLPELSGGAANEAVPVLVTLGLSFGGALSQTVGLRGGTESFDFQGHEMVSSWGITTTFGLGGPTVVIHELSLEEAGP